MGFHLVKKDVGLPKLLPISYMKKEVVVKDKLPKMGVYIGVFMGVFLLSHSCYDST